MLNINKLILRSGSSPYGDTIRNSVLRWDDVDGNFLTLKGSLIQDITLSGNNLTFTTVDNQVIDIDLTGATCSGLYTDDIYNCSGDLTVWSDLTVNGNVVINGSATTINTEVIQSEDNNIVLNYSGNTASAEGGGITVAEAQGAGVDSLLYVDSNGCWHADPGFCDLTVDGVSFSAQTPFVLVSETSNSIIPRIGNNTIQTDNPYSTIAGGNNNIISATTATNDGYSFIGAGRYNTILSTNLSTYASNSIVGGIDNTLKNGYSSEIVGGYGNYINGQQWINSIVGGYANVINSNGGSNWANFIGNGGQNQITNSSVYSSIVGGESNTMVEGGYSSLIGGKNNYLGYSNESVIGGGRNNQVVNTVLSSIGGGYNNQIDNPGGGGINLIGGGGANQIRQNTIYSSIVGGLSNQILSGSNHTVIVGGRDHITDSSNRGFIGGGRGNQINSVNYGTIVGGKYNNLYSVAKAGAEYSTIIGGENNTIKDSSRSLIGVGYKNTIYNGYALNASYNTIINGIDNKIYTTGATNFSNNVIIGGTQNSVFSQWGLVGNGLRNYVGLNGYRWSGGVLVPNPAFSEYASSIVGGVSNKVYGSFNSVVGGTSNFISSRDLNTSIVGGESNSTYTYDAYGILDTTRWGTGQFIGGGHDNNIYGSTGFLPNFDATSRESTIVGGRDNYIDSSNRAFIGGGFSNGIFTKSKYSVLVGGINNTIETGQQSSIVGGARNYVNDSYYCAIVGGRDNEINSPGFASNDQFIGGGRENKILGNTFGYLSNYSSIIGGQLNTITAATHSIIGGGLSNTLDTSNYSFIGGGKDNIVSGSSYGNILGYGNNINNSFASTVIGGWNNVISSDGFLSTMLGGYANEISALGPRTAWETILGGRNNKIHTYQGFSLPDDIAGGNIIGGGAFNTISGGTNNPEYSRKNTILNGKNNLIELPNGLESKSFENTIVGGRNHIITNSRNTVIGGGWKNLIDSKNANTVIDGGTYNTITHGYSFVQDSDRWAPFPFETSIGKGSHGQTIGGGFKNTIYGTGYTFIDGNTGPYTNQPTDTAANTIGGGSSNKIQGGSYNVIAGGGRRDNPSSFPGGNYINGQLSAIGGGVANRIYGRYSVIGGGGFYDFKRSFEGNRIKANASFIGGGMLNYITTESYGGFGFNPGNSISVIGGGRGNYIYGASFSYGSILGGSFNKVQNHNATIGGGYGNRTGYGGITTFPDDGNSAFVGGGVQNRIYSNYGAIVGGEENELLSGSEWSFIGGGYRNTMYQGYRDVIVGGRGNYIGYSIYGFIGGGFNNTINGQTTNTDYSSILGGQSNTVSHSNSHIIGSNITSISANTTHVERFNIGTVDTGSTSTEVLVLETNGMVNTSPVSTITGGLSGKYVEVITGYTANVTQTITHNLGTGDEVVVDVIDTTNNERIGVVIDNYQTNALDLTLSQNYASIKIVIIG